MREITMRRQQFATSFLAKSRWRLRKPAFEAINAALRADKLHVSRGFAAIVDISLFTIYGPHDKMMG